MATMLDNLNDILFRELERLNCDNMSEDAIAIEVSRAKAISDVSSKVLEGGRLSLDAAKFIDTALDANAQVPLLLRGK